MDGFDRRTYLKGIIAGTGALSIGGTAVALGQNSTPKKQQEQSAVQDCPAGTVELAKYEVYDNDDEDDRQDLNFAEGEDVVSFSNIEYNSEGEIIGFNWTSQSLVAVVLIKYGTKTEHLEGGYTGRVDVPEDASAISNASFCGPRGGRAVLCETMDKGETYDAEMHVTDDPAKNGSHEGVVQITSHGMPTPDYAHSMVNVATRLGERVQIGDLTKVTFDYLEGSKNTQAAPDEIFVSFLDSDPEDPDDDALWLAVRTENDGKMGDDDSWRQFDVLEAMDKQWSVEKITSSDVSSSKAAIKTARALRGPSRDTDLSDTYSSATLVGVGFGAGNTIQGTTIDRYYDDLVVDWSGSSGPASFDFPATVPTNIDAFREQGNSIVVTVLFTQDEMGLSFDDAVQRTVKLNVYKPFSPPIERGVPAKSITTSGTDLTAKFDAEAVTNLVDDDEKFIISGDFDVPTGSAFFGVGTR